MFGLTRTLQSGLDATVRVGQSRGVHGSHGDVVVVSGIEVGVGYLPLREISNLTCAYGLDVKRVLLLADGTLESDNWDEDVPDEEIGGVDGGETDRPDDESEEERRSDFKLHAHTEAEVSEVARQISEVVVAHGCRVAERYASVHDLVAAVAPVEGAALLAADGELAAARAALAGLDLRSDARGSKARRCEYQLQRWIDSGADRSILPTEAPPRASRARRERPRSFAEVRQRAGERTKGNREASAAARARARGLGRPQQRAILAEELAAREIPYGDIELELRVDHLWDTDADQWRNLGKGALSLGVKALNAIRNRDAFISRLEDRWDAMELLEPPDPAFFDVPSEAEAWVTVELMPTDGTALGRIYGLVWPKPVGVGSLESAWLRRSDRGDIAVSVGDWELGIIPTAASALFAQAIDESAFRGEYPKLPARIGFLGQPREYILEVARPSSW